MKGRPFKYFVLSVLFYLCSCLTWAQNAAKDLLIGSIKREYTLIFSKDCPDNCFELLKSKFDAAQLYLTEELKKFVLVDSSKFYENKKKELAALEQLSPEKDNEKDELKRRLEHTYLLLSVAKPLKCDSLFMKLISSFMNETLASHKIVKMESIIFYKNWLYELLKTRFQNETNLFGNNNAALFVNQIIQLYDEPFKSIEDEEKRLEKLINYALIVSNNSAKYDFPTLTSNIYRLRIIHAEKELNLRHSEALFDYIEKLYLSAVKIDPNNPELKYNFGVFYYNEVVYLTKETHTELNERELKIKEEKIKHLREKSTQFLHLE